MTAGVRARVYDEVNVLRSGRLIGNVPNVEKLPVGRGRDISPLFAGGAVQRGTNIFFGVVQFRQLNLERGAGFQLVKVGDDRRNHRFVLAVASLGHVHLRHRREMAPGFLRVLGIHRDFPVANLTLT